MWRLRSLESLDASQGTRQPGDTHGDGESAIISWCGPPAVRGEAGMSLARVAGAVACFIVFGGVAWAMGASARSDWREGRRTGDRITLFFAVQQWWPAFMAAVVATVGSVVILLG